MNITIEQLMATIGRLHVQVDFLAAENATLKSTIEELSKDKPVVKE
jgi:prefoldin subunit 5